MIKHLLYIICIAFLAVSCSDTISAITDLDDPSSNGGMAGEPVQFICVGKAPQATTRSATDGKDDVYEVEGFTYAGKNPNIDKFYSFTITMAKKTTSDPGFEEVGTSKYDIKEKGNDVTPPTEDDALTGGMEERGEGEFNDGTEPAGKNYLGDGTLTPASGETPLYWPDNVNEYGFHVVSNNGTLKKDQRDPSSLTGSESELEASSGYNFWSNDHLEGYGYIPGRFDVLNNYNFRTTNKWYTHNQMVWKGANATSNVAMPANPDIFKRVPLYMLHKRAWITVILKAGTGVTRRSLHYAETGGNSLSRSVIYSKKKDTEGFDEIYPWRQPATITYSADKNGDAGTESSTALHAIVEPHPYSKEELLTKIVLNGQTFTFSPNNDGNYDAENYNLEAGKHLIITANLTTDRIVLLTAHIEDWEDVTYSSICDDYGLQGDPFIIETRDQLRAFLKNTAKYNKPGNIALVSAKTLNLEKKRHDDDNLEEVLVKGYKYPEGKQEEDSDWEPLPLHCTLNLAGCEISSAGQLFTAVGQYGSLVNGTVVITGDRGDYPKVEGTDKYEKMPAAICEVNRGTIEQINVKITEEIAANKDVYATQGGIAATNFGHILSCSNDLEVRGKTGYIGGIAGTSLQGTWTDPFTNGVVNGTLPIIDHCTVNGRVGIIEDTVIKENFGSAPNCGVGGIVGLAENRVTNNTFNYGIPFNYQGDAKFKNIVQAKPADKTLTAQFNSWPTGVLNNEVCSENTNNNAGTLFTAVIDCQSELEMLLSGTNNSFDKRYRISRDFEVDNTWSYGVSLNMNSPDPTPNRNIKFELDGDDKTIFTNGKMLFTNIQGYIHDLTINCKTSVIEAGTTQNTEAISPFAFSVEAEPGQAESGHLKNVKVKMSEEDSEGNDLVIQAPIPAGLVVIAYNKARIENCKVEAKLQVRLKQPDNGGKLNTDMRLYCGGIAAQTSTATLSGCHFYGSISADNETWIEEQDQHLFFRGGIVGGVVFLNQDPTPKTEINDCASWWGEIPPTENKNKWSPCGSIIGSQYWFRGTTQQDGMEDDKCTGNWWYGEFQPIGDIEGETEAEAKIGRRNGIQPEREDL